MSENFLASVHCVGLEKGMSGNRGVSIRGGAVPRSEARQARMSWAAGALECGPPQHPQGGPQPTRKEGADTLQQTEISRPIGSRFQRMVHLQAESPYHS